MGTVLFTSPTLHSLPKLNTFHIPNIMHLWGDSGVCSGGRFCGFGAVGVGCGLGGFFLLIF